VRPWITGLRRRSLWISAGPWSSKGELNGSGDLALYGQMEGRIRLPAHTLTIGPHADIKADISAKAVVIMDAVTGNVTAGEKVETRATGSVTGDIASPRHR
jgi:cytoskeletal protein CcmA (bactofilin family)